MDSLAIQEFSRTLFNMRPDIALSVLQIIFLSDLRHLLPHVSVPCHIIQSMKDLAVPVVVSEYLYQNLGAKSIVEVMSTEGHLPQLSSPDVVTPVLLRHIRNDIAVWFISTRVPASWAHFRKLNLSSNNSKGCCFCLQIVQNWLSCLASCNFCVQV